MWLLVVVTWFLFAGVLLACVCVHVVFVCACVDATYV